MKRLPRSCVGYVGLAIVFIWLSLSLKLGFAQEGTEIELSIRHPNAAWLARGGADSEAPKLPEGLASSPEHRIGWLSFDFEIVASGWRRLAFEGKSGTGGLRWEVQARDQPLPVAGPFLASRLPGEWIWLQKGAYRLIVSQLHWTRMSQIQSVRLKSPDADGALPFRIIDGDGGHVFEAGQCEALQIQIGGNDATGSVSVAFERTGSRIETSFDVEPSAAPSLREISLPCENSGDVNVAVKSAGRGGKSLESTTRYAVFDTSEHATRLERGLLVVEIDASGRLPDYTSGDTSLRANGGLEYREGGRNGTLPFSRRQTDQRPSWFAYRVDGLVVGKPYFMEIEYPDDAARVMVASYQDSKQRSYPTSVGMETGGVWPLSQHYAQTNAVVWPTSSDGRVVVYTVHNGLPAAIRRIRFYEAASVARSLPSSAYTHRRMVAWYEEGENFRSLTGITNRDAIYEPVTRFVQLAATMGANVIAPTVVVYDSQMYPSSYNLTFRENSHDITKAILLAAQRAGMVVFPEFHPRADELSWDAQTSEDMSRRFLVSKDGKRRVLRADGTRITPPFYNPLNADVQGWYVGAVVEMAERYAHLRSFAGVQLRLSSWQNPTLNNLSSLDWGYDAETVRRFVHDTNAKLPVEVNVHSDAPSAVQLRYKTLIAAFKREWVAWRADQITQMLKRLVSRVREVRADLEINLFLFTDDHSGATTTETLLEMGIDLAALKNMNGVTIIDGRQPHGSKESALHWQREMRHRHRRSDLVGALTTERKSPSTIQPMHYQEITPNAADRSSLGWPSTSRRPSWTSAASEPPGRFRLERYAGLTGKFDVFMLGDGGNGYVFSGEGLYDYAREFTSLPAVKFKRVLEAPDGTALWSSGRFFYVVNETSNYVNLRIMVPGAVGLIPLVTSSAFEMIESGVRVTLEPYAMRGFQANEAVSEVSAFIDAVDRR